MKSKIFRSVLIASLVVSQQLHAGSPLPPAQGPIHEAVEFSPFARGTHEVEFLIGAFDSIMTSNGRVDPDTDYSLASLRYGWMLGDPSRAGIFSGNWEFLIGAFGGLIDSGPGNYIVGADIALRYNFIRPNSRLVPFFQIGGGGAFSDAADEDRVQRLIGSDLSFELQSAIGLRWMVTDRWALTASVQYQHFSNAGLRPRNRGLNAIGGLVGVSCFY